MVCLVLVCVSDVSRTQQSSHTNNWAVLVSASRVMTSHHDMVWLVHVGVCLTLLVQLSSCGQRTLHVPQCEAAGDSRQVCGGGYNM